MNCEKATWSLKRTRDTSGIRGPCLSVLLHFLSKRGYSLFEEIPFESKLHIMVARPRVLGGKLEHEQMV
uniref:Uncharacterized protein n=1 Tax=Salix viminalis TaxID=40686 RepID=A0A6N2K4E8_SALVM